MFAPDQIHWNAAGNRAVYDYIAPRLEPLFQAYTAAESTAR